jgi:ribosome modulation factor
MSESKPQILRQNPWAWQQGCEAGQTGHDSSSCPYPADSALGWAWSSGFIEGKAERERT